LWLLFSSEPARAQDGPVLLAEAERLAFAGGMMKARALYAKAEAVFREQGDARNELYAKFGRLRKDLESDSYTAVREEIDRDISKEIVQKDPHLKMRALALRGLVNLNLNTRAAQEDWTEVYGIASTTNDPIWQNRATGFLAIIAGVSGNLGAAGVTLVRVIGAAAKLRDIGAELTFSTYLGNGMTLNGMADRALPILDAAIERARSREEADLPTQLYVAKIRALIYLPAEKRAQGRKQAKELIETTLNYARHHNIMGAQTELLNQAGLIAIEERDLERGEALFQETVKVADSAHLLRMKAAALLRLSQIYRHMKQPGKAATTIETSIETVQRAGQPYDLPLYIAEKAEVQAALNNLQAADALYTQALDLIEGLLVNASSSQVKSSMIGNMSDIYVGHFRFTLTRRQNIAEAFRIVETARGRALFDSMRHAIESKESAQPTQAEQEIARIQKRLLNDRLTPTQTKHLLAQLETAYNRLAPIEYTRNRDEIKMLRQEPVTLRTLRRSLSPGEAILEYVLDTEASFCLEITRAGVKVHSIPGRTHIDGLVKEYLREVKAKKDQRPATSALFERVFAPALTSIPSSITVVPDGSLHLIPVGALVDKKGEYLIASVTVSTAPSATVFHRLRSVATRKSPTKPFLGVAFSPTETSPALTASTARGVFDAAGGNLKPLLFARQEVLQAAGLAGQGAVTLTGAEASESALKAQSLGDFRILHFAAHGLGNITEPDRAALVLAPGSLTEDGLWQAREIRQSRIAADVVTLSACDTATGRLQGEEGVMNLARMFLVAGAKSVLATLWSVDDRSTATLMSRFYKHLGAGRPVAEALRHAQLDFLKEFGDYTHPYFWGGFSVIGDGTRRISF
jgi:CHAT domain-containing protein